jgi:GT2 family glycosyltransferase
MPELPQDGPSPYALVIVPTLGVTTDLERCLTALGQQHYDNFEVLVVDSRPSPEGAALARRHGARYMENSSTSRAAACNDALRVLDCEIVLFTDDDCAPPPTWVGNLVRHFDRLEVAGVGGPHVAPVDQSFWGKVVDVAFASPLLSLGLRYAKTYNAVCEVAHNPGCNAAYRKAVLDAVGGFSHAPFGAEDVALDYKITSLGNRLWFDPEAVTYHRRRDRISTLARQMWAYGRGRADTNARFPGVARAVHALPTMVLIAGVGLLAVALVAGGLELLPAQAVTGSRSARIGRALLIASGLPLSGLGLAYLAGAVSAALSSSPYRSLSTVVCAPPVMMLSVIQYGRGFLHWHRVLKPRFAHKDA